MLIIVCTPSRADWLNVATTFPAPIPIFATKLCCSAFCSVIFLLVSYLNSVFFEVGFSVSAAASSDVNVICFGPTAET